MNLNKQPTKKKKVQMFNKINYTVKLPGERNEAKGTWKRRRELKLGAGSLHKRQTMKPATPAAGGDPCFRLELSSGQSKEGNKIRST